MPYTRFIQGLAAELTRQHLPVDMERLRETILDTIDLQSYRPIRALRTPARQLWGLTIFRTPLPVSGVLLERHDAEQWSWSQVDAISVMLELADYCRVQPSAIEVADDSLTLFHGEFVVMRVAPVVFAACNAREVARYETLFDGLQAEDVDAVLKRLRSLPGFRRFGDHMVAEHLGRQGELLQPTMNGLAKWLKGFIETLGGTLALHAAQELLASMLGFADWHQLKHAEQSNIAPLPKVIYDVEGRILAWYPTAGAALWYLDKLLATQPVEDVRVEVRHGFHDGVSVSVRTSVSKHPDWWDPPPSIYCMSTPQEADGWDVDSSYGELATRFVAATATERSAVLDDVFGMGQEVSVRLAATDARQNRTESLTLGAESPVEDSHRKAHQRGRA